MLAPLLVLSGPVMWAILAYAVFKLARSAVRFLNVGA